MSDSVPQRAAGWVDFVFKLSVPVMIGVSFYLNATFASKEEVRALVKSQEDRVTKAETAILLLTKDNETNTRQDKALDDHETRLRLLEKTRP